MKKNVRCIAFLTGISLISTYAQAQPWNGFQNGNADTVITSSWKNGKWEKNTRTYYSYNGDCSPQMFVTQGREKDTWKNLAQTAYTYYPSKKVKQEESSVWTGTAWLAISRITYIYNAALLTTEELEQYRGATWSKENQHLYTYDANGYLIKDLFKNWDPVSKEYFNVSQTDYKNNAAGISVTERTQEWEDDEWLNEDSTSYTFYDMNRYKMSVSFDWENDKWVNAEKTTGTYENNLLMTVVSEEWDDNEWVNSLKMTFTYDSKNRVKTVTNQEWDADTETWQNDALIEYSYTTGCTVLPLTLLDFTAESVAGAVALSWQTSNEVNTSGFNVQRSEDGISFSTIGNVKSAGGAILNQYAFKDCPEYSLPGVLYYRLEMVDFDGKSSLSKVVKVVSVNERKVAIFPNPVNDQLIFIHDQDIEGASIIISAPNGKTVLRKVIGNIPGMSRSKLDVSTLSEGVYIMKLIGKNFTTAQKFVKR